MTAATSLPEFDLTDAHLYTSLLLIDYMKWSLFSAAAWFVGAYVFPTGSLLKPLLHKSVRQKLQQKLEDHDREALRKTPAEAAKPMEVSCNEPDTGSSVRKRLHRREVSLLHLIIGCFASCFVIFNRKYHQHPFYVGPEFTIMAAISTGYFVWDFYIIIADWGKGSEEWLFHAMGSVVGLTQPFWFPWYPASLVVAKFYFAELSTIFYTLRWACMEVKDESKFKLITELLFIVTFFSIRIVYLPLVLLELRKDFPISLGASGAGFFYSIINFYWGAMILRKIFAMIKGGKGGKKA
eukprot:GHVU01128774.1.p1 GENE.GHVU01128774.1~~GHVU01128774.1.p1  ORF type:complete len:295 (+),score=27.15 GHVU01128774.1:29-913(+)